MTQGRQLDTQQSQSPLVPAQRSTQFGVALPPVFNAFGTAVYQKQRPPRATKPQWIEGPLYRKFGLEPALARTPRCHRRGHKQPSDLRIAMKNYPAKWRADEKAEGSFTAVKCEVDQIAGTGKSQMPTAIWAESRFIFDRWLGDRSMGDMRVIREVTSKDEELARTAIIPGFTWSDFDHTPEMPTKTNTEEWELYLTDFATDTYSPLASYLDMKYSKVDGKVVLPQGLWLRYHGCNMYAMSSILATNMAAASDEEVVASETACGRGVYTSQSWDKAQQYASPHRLPGSRVFTKTIALFVIPGASGVGGVGVWIKRKEALWEHKSDGTWESRPRWFWVLEKDVADEGWEEPGSKAIPCPALETRKDGRLPGSGEVPWTTSDGTTSNSSEDQSSVVYLAGFFVSQCSASDIRKVTCQSREKIYFDGWDELLEPPVGRALSSWNDVAPRDGGPTEAEKRKESTQAKMAQRSRPAAGVFGDGSSVGDSPRTEGLAPLNQTQTYQDRTGNYKLGKIKKTPGKPLWLVYRFSGADNYRLLCAKYFGASHETTERHLTRLGDVNYYIKACQYPFEEWLYQDPTSEPLALLATSTEEETASASACPTRSQTAGRTAPSASIPACVSWSAYTEEKRAAEQEGADLIYKICTETARIIVESPWIATKAIWLVPGRPSYLVYKEDSAGMPETWKDPYCILCASYATQDHIASDKHTAGVVTTASNAIFKGWGQIVEWLEQNSRETMEDGSHVPEGCASNDDAA